MKKCDPLAISETLTTRIKKGAFLTVKAGDAMNTMTIGWGLIGFIWQRSVFMVAVRDSRHTFSIMEKAVGFHCHRADGGHERRPHVLRLQIRTGSGQVQGL